MRHWIKAGVAASLMLVLLPACETTDVANVVNSALAPGGSSALNLETIVAGLKDALRVGSQNAVSSASAKGGYLDNARIRIPVPQQIEKVTSAMRKIGMGSMVDDFETKMNRGAESAAKEAAPVFWDAIKGMTFEDAKGILNGGDTAATDYFRGKTTAKLTELYRPVVHANLDEVGAVRGYNDLMGRYEKIPLASKPTFDLDTYVTEKSLDGLFLLLADEESKIRKDPAARTTELLKQVFGK